MSNYSKLSSNYSYEYVLDPLNQELIDIDGDGNFVQGYSLNINFSSDERDSNGNRYSLQDLLDGQGQLGGTVDLPGDSTISYENYEYDESGQIVYDENDQIVWKTTENDPEPKLWVYQLEDPANAYLSAVIGGFISDKEAPVGEYKITYTTGDGIVHQENLYLHENRAESLYYPYPEFEIDQEGFVESITIRFENGDGDALENPSVLGFTYFIALWEDAAQVNGLVRGQNYYESIHELSKDDVYKNSPSVISLTDPSYPTNNGHKIYYEDIEKIEMHSGGGDGVNRMSVFRLNNPTLFPALSKADISADTVAIEYEPSGFTMREVVSIKYKFDNGNWTEVSGFAVGLAIPNGATILYSTAKDTSGFYEYPPDETDLTK